MKSKNPKIQILKKGMAILLSAMFLATPITYAATSLDDSYLQGSWWEQILYGTVGSTAKEIEEYFESGKTTLYITNETQLRALAEYVNNGNNCEGKEIILLNDIELDSEKQWIPIGCDDKEQQEGIGNFFEGIFNGQGHTISGLSYEERVDDEFINIGLFGLITGNAIIKNLTTKDFHINIEPDPNNFLYNTAGNIVGYIAGDAKIEKCINKSNITSINNVGGIAGAAADNSEIDGCYNYGEVTSYGYVGGIVGRTLDNFKIKNCVNKGKIKGYYYTGGILGNCEGKEIIVENCINEGQITAEMNYAGGIVGISKGDLNYSKVYIRKCVNYGDIYAPLEYRFAGGILGGSYNTVEIEKCKNVSSVYAGEPGAIIGEVYYDGTSSNVYGCISNTYDHIDQNVYFVSRYGQSAVVTNSIIINKLLEENEVKSLGDARNFEVSNIVASDIFETNQGLNDVDGIYTVNSNGEVVHLENIGASIETTKQNIYTKTFGPTNVTYKIKRNGQDVLGNTYFKTGDKLQVIATFDKYLAKTYGPLAPITEAPTLKINNSKEMAVESINAITSNYTTTITYTYTVQEGDNFDITSLNMSKQGTIYACGSDYATNHPDINVSSVSVAVSDMRVDTIKPIITTKVFVENMLVTERYTAGKEIIFEVTTSERIEGMYETPQIQVSFSESGVGKYNYTEETNKSGYAKCKSSRINLDGTTTWIYSYQIQERDEGYLEFSYVEGDIYDLAGNETDIVRLFTPTSNTTSGNITGIEWNNDLNVTYKFYKNSVSAANEITSQTHLLNTDDLIVVATYDKVLYVHYGLSDGKNTNIRLNGTYKDRAPSIYLNGDSALKQSSIDSIKTTNYVEATELVEAKSGTTTVQYRFTDIAKKYGLKQLTEIRRIVLKNENNGEALTYNGTQVSTNGLIPYAEKWYSEYNSEQEKEYNKTLTAGKIKTTDELRNVIIDPIGISDTIQESEEGIYADTTAPTLTITADKANPTNSDKITYTFKFSEEIDGFDVDDITVINGRKLTNTEIDGLESDDIPFFACSELGKTYHICVEPTITEGELRVIVEQGACVDLVGKGNVRQENVINIDKVRPTLESCEIEKKGETLVVVATFSEEIIDASDLKAEFFIGGNDQRGAFEDLDTKTEGVQKAQIFDKNKVKFVYNISGADGGKVKAQIWGTVKDLAGNNSEELNVSVESEIVLKQEAITHGWDTYTFEKNGKPISNFTNPTYFVKGDEITVTKDTKTEVEVEVEGEVQTETQIVTEKYSYVLEDEDDLTHITHIGFVEKTNEENEKITEIEFYNTYAAGRLAIDEANIWFDTVAPKVTTEIVANNPVSNNIYNVGSEFTIKSTTSEEIQEDTSSVPEINVKFGEVDGKFNNGKAQYVETIKNENGTTTWVYRYVVSVGDEGNVSLSYVNGKVIDLAGNRTTLTELNTEENIFDLNNISVDATAPTVIITTNTSNSTNQSQIEYTFTWSEEVKGFTVEDIILPEGITGTFNSETNKMVVNYNSLIPLGNEGEVTVAVVEKAVKDIIGNENAYTTNTLKIDRIAPIFVSLEAYTESNISLNKEIDTVKEYYKAGDIVKIVATFSENIEKSAVPELALQFSESGNAKGNISESVKSGNKMTYTYTITNGDMGTLSVKGFVGEVEDAAGNKTAVAKKVLDGNAIIADTDEPSLLQLNVTTSQGVYNAGNSIRIEAIYDEEVYALVNNEIKNITSGTAPILKVKFGNGTEREATFDGYVGEDKTKLKYTISIVNGDNGILSITSYNNKENVKVCDIAGNEAGLNKNQTGNQITADTIRPVVQRITAVVENPTISGTDIYHKEENRIKITLTFSEEVRSYELLPEILIGFSEEASVEPTEYNTYAYESDWNVNSRTIEYTYTIRKGDNGYLWVKVPEGEFKDIAGNTNVAKTAEEKSNVFADTTIPTVTLYRDTEETQNNQIIKIIATFNENVYDLNGNRRITLTNANAPKLIYSFGNGANKETKDNEASVNGDKITYTITKDRVEDDGDLHYELAKGNLCDRAGNELYKTTLDTTAPVLESVLITSNAGIYDTYCKEGKEIYVIATFNEPIKEENMKLKAKIGEVELAELLDGAIVEENDTKVKFTYTVKAGDMGVFKILDICGETDNKITEENADKTYGWVRDEYGNQNNIYSFEDEKVIPIGNAEADTKDPYITSIKAIANGKEVATYTKEDGKDAVVNVGRTNANIVEYIVTYSEKVPYSYFENISITNGRIKDIQYTNTALNEYKITVQTTVEGVQSLIILDNTMEDKAGNTDEFVRLNAVTVDFTKPTVRFISEYNGGTYVLPTNIDKVEIRPNVEINEDIEIIEYKWDEGEYARIENYSASSDIAVPTKVFTQAGTYVLHIRVVDLAGNVTETSKTYVVSNSVISIELDTYEATNQDVTATVSFGYKLTDNKKVTFKAEGTNDVIVLNAKGTNEKGTEYTISTNGTIYAEATDRVGNKVFTELAVRNIDKENPVIELELNGANLVIGTEKTNATIKTNVKVEDNKWVETAKYAFLQEDIDVYNITAEQKAKISNNLEYEAKIENAVSTKDKTPYYLYVIAKDEAGNETVIKSEAFTVVDTNERTVEGEEEPISAEKPVEELIIFEQMEENIKNIAYVNVRYDDSIIKESEVTLADETYGFVNEYNTVELYGNTTIKVEAWDICGNRVYRELPIDDIKGPEFTISGNPEGWTNSDAELEIYSNTKLESLTLNRQNILGDEDKHRVSKVIETYGEYTFVAEDVYGNVSDPVTVEVKIDKSVPEITDVNIEDGKVVIIANDIDKTLNKELSGLSEYAITDTTEVPVEWSTSNVINVIKDDNFFVWVKDNAGNITMKEEIVVRDITAPELTITTDVELDKWTNTNIKVEVKSNEELSLLNIELIDDIEESSTVTDILSMKSYTIISNGTYEIRAKDKSGNETKERIEVTKIDKVAPQISNAVANGKDITITAIDDLSEIEGYAVTSTTEEPVKWSKSKVIKVTKDGTYYVWAKDNAGNIRLHSDTIIVDTTAPTITFNYLSQTITVGMPIEAYVITNEEAIISYSWDNENWINSDNLIRSIKVSKKSTTIGKAILYVKAIDNGGNESQVHTLEFNIVNMEEIKEPAIVFEDIPTIQINGAKYVKVSSEMTAELLTDSMNKEALCGKTPEFTKLTEDGKLRTGSEIAINGSTKYIIVVNGDVNGDGIVAEFINDIITLNRYRIKNTGLSTAQILAGDINNDGIIDFIDDIMQLNRYRIGIVSKL